MKFSELNLTEKLLAGLSDINFVDTTPIQEKAIPHICNGDDVIGTAQTGTGKTGAFVIPILDRILRGDRNGTKAVILTPTRELAQQIDEQIFAIGYHTGITSATVIGGSDFSTQAKALKAGVDIIVATPGRLIDQHKVVNIDFSTVEHLILDEADRMLDMGFLPDMTKIISWMPKERQTLLFSATMPKEIEKLASQIMSKPVSVEIARSKPSQSVEQRAYLLKSDQKIPLVKKIFDTISWDSCIIFTSTKKGTDELQRLLKKQGIRAGSIHGDRSQEERNKALNDFKNGKIPVIVATNVIARGIDIKDVSMIINYDVPRSTDDYVHRIGRTGRYDKSGIAITLVTKRDNRAFSDIDKIKHNSIKKIHLPSSFDDSSNFYWHPEEEEKGGQKKSQGRTKPSGKKPSPDRTGERSSSDRDRSSGKRTSKGRSGRPGKRQEKETKSSQSRSKRSARDSGNQQEAEKRENPKTSNGKSTKDPVSSSVKSQERTSGDNRPQNQNISTAPSNGSKPAMEISIVEKATERNRYSREPAKGFWGIIKSMIPKFRSGN